MRTDGDRVRFWMAALFAAIVLEGALRKWVLPADMHRWAFVAKDVIALGFILRYPLPSEACTLRRLRVWLTLTGVLLLPSLWMGLREYRESAMVTFKNALLWPLFACHLSARVSGTVLGRLVPLVSITACGMAVLGAVQYRSGAGTWINQYAWHRLGSEQAVASFGAAEGVRATGTFSYVAGMAGFAIFVFNFMLWRFLTSDEAVERRLAALGAISAVFCGLASGSRSTVVSFAAALAVTIAVSGRRRLALRVCSLAILAAVSIRFFIEPKVVESFMSRWSSAQDSLIERILGRELAGDYSEMISTNPFGVGLGQRTGYAVLAEQVSAGTGQVQSYDHGGSSAVLEAGLLGLFALWITRFVALTLAIRGLRSQWPVFRLGLAVGAVSLFAIFGGIWYEHNATAFHWLGVGLWLGTDPELLAGALRAYGSEITNVAARRQAPYGVTHRNHDGEAAEL